MKKVLVLFIVVFCLAQSALAVSYVEFAGGYNAAAAKAKDRFDTGAWPSVKRFGSGDDQSCEAKFSKSLVSAALQMNKNNEVTSVNVMGKTKNHAGFMRVVDHALSAYAPQLSTSEKSEAIKRAKLNDKVFLKEARGGVNGFFQEIEYKGIVFMTAAGIQPGDMGVSFWKK